MVVEEMLAGRCPMVCDVASTASAFSVWAKIATICRSLGALNREAGD